jgi:hypothetical protein
MHSVAALRASLFDRDHHPTSDLTKISDAPSQGKARD